MTICAVFNNPTFQIIKNTWRNSALIIWSWSPDRLPTQRHRLRCSRLRRWTRPRTLRWSYRCLKSLGLRWWPLTSPTTNTIVMTTKVAQIVELDRKVLVLPCCESQMIGCCVCPAHFPVHQSHTRRDCRQTSGSSCQIASSSLHLPPPHPRSPHLHSRHCRRDLRSISGRGLGYSITPFDLNKEKTFTWITAPAATPPPPPPPSSAPPVCWRAVCYVLESQIQPPWSSAMFACELSLS